MQLWCSAVEAANVDPALAEFRHESLAEKFNYEYSEKEAIVSSRLKKSNSVLTPRRASTEPPKAPTIGATAEKVASQSAQASQEVLDTPRGSLVPGQPTGQPAAAAAAAAAPPPARTAPTMPTGVPPKPAASPTPPTPPPSLPPPGSSPPAVDDDDTFQITVPEGVNPGDKLKATTPSGVKVLLRVPEGAGPGTELNFTLPKGSSSSKAAEDDTAAQAIAATRIQAKIRGKSVRKSVASARPAGAPPKPAPKLLATELGDGAEEEDQAAVRLQAAVRGHAVRYEQEEVRRVEWLKYYMQPDVAEYEKALELTCTPAEEGAVEDAKQENSRVQWLEYFVADGKLSQARELGWDGKNPPPPAGSVPNGICGVFAKCFGGGGGAATGAEAQRKLDFTKAVRAYDWEAAQALATSSEEKADVVDSKNRVEWMEYHLAQGDRTQALDYAITSEERIRIES